MTDPNDKDGEAYIQWDRYGPPPGKNLGDMLIPDGKGGWMWETDNISDDIDPDIKWGEDE